MAGRKTRRRRRSQAIAERFVFYADAKSYERETFMGCYLC